MKLNLRLATLAALALSSASLADTIFTTGDPFGGPMGVTGFDVCTTQSVALRFTPDQDYALTSISLWLMSNVDDEGPPPTITISLRTNMNPGAPYISAPSHEVLESWTQQITAIGHTPAFQAFPSTASPTLHAGQTYWIVADSAAPNDQDPIWNWSGQYSAFVATNHGPGTTWISGNNIAFAAQIDGTPVPPSPSCGSADFNHDGDTATDADIEDFFACLAGNCCPTCDTTDFNNDGDTATDADIEAFFRVLAGGPC